MIFKTHLLDNEKREWNFTGEVVGHGMYDDDNGNKFGIVVEGFNIVDIELSNGFEKIKVESIAVMPDRFNERDIEYLEVEAEEKFLEVWMDVQDCAHDLNN